MSSNILKPHEIQHLIDKLALKAERLEMKAVALKGVRPITPKAIDKRSAGHIADAEARICREHIRQLACLLHQ